MINIKTLITALALSSFCSLSWGQSVVTLESFNLDSTEYNSTARPADPNANAFQSCLENPHREACENGQPSSRIFSLSDVVNLGIIERSEVEVANEEGEVIQIENRVEPLPSIDLEILFDYDSAELRSDQMAPLVALVRDLEQIDFGQALLVVMGHTDGVGSAAYNRELSYRRAVSVTSFLHEMANIPLHRIRSSGMGFDFLRYPDSPDHPGNRRVQILLVE